MFVTSNMALSKAVKGKLKTSDYFSQRSVSSAMVEEEEDYRVDRSFMTDAYRVNSWVRAIVDTTKERAIQSELFPIPLSTKIDTKSNDYSDTVKRHMESVMNLMMIPNEDYESFESLEKKVMHDIMVYDDGGMEIVRGERRDGKKIPFALRSNVTGEELYVNAQKNGVLKAKAYVQLREGNEKAWWNKQDFMNFIKNRRSGYSNGTSPIESIAASILGDLEAMNYNISFFENNARPNLAFLFQNLGFGQGKGALERAKKWYYQEHKGQPHKPLFMGTQKGEVEIKQLTVPNKDMEFSEWQSMLLSRIMAVYGMQPMVIGAITGTTGKLNSELQGEQYKKNAIIPLVKVFLHTMNSVLIWGDQNFNYDDIYLTSANLDIDDEKRQADIWEIFLRTGVITINQVRGELQMPPVEWGNEPFVPLNFSPLSTLREFQESRIEANRKSAMSAGVDNNVGGEGKDPVDPDKKDKKDKKDGKSAQIEHMLANFNPPTGLEKIDTTEVITAVSKILQKSESTPKYFDMGATSMRSVVRKFELEWPNILKSR